MKKVTRQQAKNILEKKYKVKTKKKGKDMKNKSTGKQDGWMGGDIFEKMVDSFLDNYPLYYDKSKILWRWNFEEHVWENIDDIDLINLVSEAKREGQAIQLKLSELILARARLRKPEQPKETWIQFKNKIYDISNGKNFNASPKYFTTNSIPWELGKISDTPNLDKLFEEWVGKKYVKSLQEFTAYCLTPNKFMQRIFAFVGGGSNGKGTFIELNEKILGEKNYTSSEMKLLSNRNFETSTLYRKLLCVMGEVSYSDLTNTNQLKKLGGGDKIRFEFKGKQPFTDKNTATVVCLTNSLPRTPDKSVGFYRKWHIIDFPNQFPIGKSPIEKIDEEEIKNYLRKCFDVLREIYNTRKFSNEGSYEERANMYEERSNPVMRFIEKFCEEIAEEKTTLRDFTNRANEYFKLHGLRMMSAKDVGKILRDEGFNIGIRKDEFGSSHSFIMNLKLNELVKLVKLA